jgi:hypothetical protein
MVTLLQLIQRTNWQKSAICGAFYRFLLEQSSPTSAPARQSTRENKNIHVFISKFRNAEAFKYF